MKCYFIIKMYKCSVVKLEYVPISQKMRQASLKFACNLNKLDAKHRRRNARACKGNRNLKEETQRYKKSPAKAELF